MSASTRPEVRHAEPARDSVVEARRAAIVASAEHLVAVHGYDTLRLKDVAREAGVSIGLIQHHFDTRDDLMLHTMREASRRRVRAWSALAAGPGSGRDKLIRLLTGATSDRHRCAMWLETCAAASRHPELRPDVQTTQDAWRATLESAIADGVGAGEFRCAIPVGDVVDVLVSLIDGLMLATAVEGDDPARRSHRTGLLLEAANRLLQPSEDLTSS